MKYDFEIKECHKRRNVTKCGACLRYSECVENESIDLWGQGIKTSGKGVKNIMRKDEVRDFLHTIYIPSNLSKDWGELLEWLESHTIRKLNFSDHNLSRLRCLEIKTKGNGSWKAFAGWRECYIDTNHVSTKFAEIYTYTDTETGQPQKIAVDNPRFSIITD